MKIEVLAKRPEQARLTLIPLVKDERLERSLKSLARRYSLDPAMLARDFGAESKKVVPSYVKKKGSTSRVYFLGLGEEVHYAKLLTVFKSFFHAQIGDSDGLLTIDLSNSTKDQQEKIVEAVVNASITGRYDLALYKTSKEKKSEVNMEIFTNSGAAKSIVDRAKKIGETQVSIMDLVNAPANKMTPTQLGNWAKQSGDKYGYDVQVLDQQQITKEGLNAVLAVNQGSEEPATFIIAQYKHPEAKKKVGVVGKGVTFDTGGLSIKPSGNMHYMKSDMGGAAAALGTIEIASLLSR